MRQLIQICVASAALVSFASCGKHHGGDDTAIDGGAYQSIRVSPESATLTVPLGGTGTQTYQVIGQAQGEDQDITASCALSLDQAFGQANAAVVTVGAHGGIATITATCGTLMGTAQLTVDLTGSVMLGSATPANAAQLFGSAAATTDATRAPGVQYPIDQAVAPLNIPPIEVQWSAGSNDLFHVSLTSTYQTIERLRERPAGDDAGRGLDLRGGHGGGRYARDRRRGARAGGAGDEVREREHGVDHVARHDRHVGDLLVGVVAGQHHDAGVRRDRRAVGRRGQLQRLPLAVRAGTRIGYSRCVGGNCGPEYIGFLKYDAGSNAWNEVVDADNKAVAGSYTTFAPPGNPFPDDSPSVAIVSLYGGALGLYDPDSGSAVASNLNTVSRESVDGLGTAANRAAMMPDWSPDGTKVVFASTANSGAFVNLDAGTIAVMDYQYTAGQHTFGTPTTLVKPPLTVNGGSYENLFFPSFSPDGKLVVFNAARAGWRDLNAECGPHARATAHARGRGRRRRDRSVGAQRRRGQSRHDLAALGAGQHDRLLLDRVLERAQLRPRITQANTAQACVENGMLQCKQIWISAISKAQIAAGLTIIRARRRCGCRVRTSRRTTSARTGRSRRRSSSAAVERPRREA